MRTPVALSSDSLSLENLGCTLSKYTRSPLFIIVLSLRRNDSSTAFLIHWCVVQRPTASRVATRSLPVLSSSMTWATASVTSFGAEADESSARCSQALSMMDWSCCVMTVCDGR